MEIVVKVNDDLYTRLFDNGTDFYDTDDILAMAKSIRKGKVLPKGHGRLIDADELIEGKVANDWIRIQAECANTIIEADKTESEE